MKITMTITLVKLYGCIKQAITLEIILHYENNMKIIFTLTLVKQ